MTFLKQPALMLLAALLCLLLGQILFVVQAPPNVASLVWPGLGLYLLGGILAVRIFNQERSDDPALVTSDWKPSRRTQLACAVGLTLFAAVLRMAWLDRVPFTLDGDAAAFALSSTNFLRPVPPPLIGTGWQSHTNVYFFLVSLMIRLFGRTVVAVRSFSALGGTLGVLAVFALGRSLWGFRVGLLAGLALAVQPFDLIFSRVGTEVVHLTWLLPLVTLSIWEGWRRKRGHWLVVGGILTGLSQYFYPGARLIPLLAIGQIGLLALWSPDGRRQIGRGLKAVALLSVGVLLSYGPMILYFLEHPDIYTARIGLVSITSSGWLAKQVAQRPWWLVMGEQIRRAYLPFHFPVDGAPLWYKWPQYLSPLDAALLSLGILGVSFSRSARWLKLYLASYLLGGIVLAGVITIDTPMPSRYIVFMPGVALLIGYALNQILRHWLAILRPTETYDGAARIERVASHGLAIGLIGAMLCIYTGLGLRAYLQHDIEVVMQSDATNQQGTYAARYLQSLPDQNYDILFLKTGYFYYPASPALPFLTNKTAENIDQPLDCTVLMQQADANSLVVLAPPERIVELRQMQAALTGAKLYVPTNSKGSEIVGVLVLSPAGSGGAASCAAPAAHTP